MIDINPNNVTFQVSNNDVFVVGSGIEFLARLDDVSRGSINQLTNALVTINPSIFQVS